MKLTLRSALENTLLISCGVPFLGIAMGGIFWWPIARFTRDPWQTYLLAGALAITVYGITLGTGGSLRDATLAWLLSVALLFLIHRTFGERGHSLEHFGCVHMAAITLAFLFSRFGASLSL